MMLFFTLYGKASNGQNRVDGEAPMVKQTTETHPKIAGSTQYFNKIQKNSNSE
jgi:hypothetical protein